MKKMANSTAYDAVNNITDAEYGACFILAAAEIGDADDIDRALEKVKAAAQRHGFDISHEIMDAYAHAQNAVATMTPNAKKRLLDHYTPNPALACP